MPQWNLRQVSETHVLYFHSHVATLESMCVKEDYTMKRTTLGCFLSASCMSCLCLQTTWHVCLYATALHISATLLVWSKSEDVMLLYWSDCRLRSLNLSCAQDGWIGSWLGQRTSSRYPFWFPDAANGTLWNQHVFIRTKTKLKLLSLS